MNENDIQNLKQTFVVKKEKTKEWPPVGKDKGIIISGFMILFTQWCLMTMISPYFPLSKTGRVISAAMRGVIISSYPFGNALTTPFIKNFIQKLGTKTIISVGLICMMAFNLFFGAVPLIFEQEYQQYFLLIFGFLYGIGSTLAETGAIFVVNRLAMDFNKLGQISAIMEVAALLGSLTGPFLGGWIFHLGKTLEFSEEIQFLFPAVVLSVLPLISLIQCYFYMPQDFFKEKDETKNFKDLLNQRRLLVMISVLLAAMIYGSMLPTLQIKFNFLPYQFNTGMIGVMFFIEGLLYGIGTYPIGLLIDRGTDTLNLIQSGLAINCLCLMMIAPFKIGSFDLDCFDNIPIAILSLLILGISQCLIIIPSLSDLMIGINADDSASNSTISTFWMMAYSNGQALGPIIGSSLLTLKTDILCRPKKGGFIRDHAHQNCFDGTFTLQTLVLIVFTLIFYFLNLKIPKYQRLNCQSENKEIKIVDNSQFDVNNVNNSLKSY